MLRYFFVSGILLISAFFIHSTLSYKCIHDDVASIKFPENNYTNVTQSIDKRDADDTFSEPFKMHAYLDEFDKTVPEKAVHRIKMALKMVSETLKPALKVRPTEIPFHLQRTSCLQYWRSGLNEGRCARAKMTPELCSIRKTDYVIPDTFLEGLIVYDSDDGPPTFRVDSGLGLRNANFILFVISRSSSWCTTEGVQAYGSYCKLDVHNRPIAGLLNLCPEIFGNRLMQLEHYYNIILHEVIHILGFSHKLFTEFFCSSTDLQCTPPKNIFKTDSYSQKRIVFPLVLEAMQEHSGCSEEDFGAPLDKSENEDPDTITSSHWDPLLMYSSVMTPSIQENAYVFLDNITLALLASSGWYKVNYTAATGHVIGKGEGCKFGLEKDCDNYKDLCDPKDSPLGCDFQHRTIGKCESVVSYHYCGIHIPDPSNSCREEKDQLNMLEANSFGYKQLCVTYNKNEEKSPACVLFRCKSKSTMDIRHNSTSWISCPLSQEVDVDETTKVSCPSIDQFCLEEKDDDANATYDNDECKKLALSIRMFFTDPSFQDLSQYSSFKQLKVKTLRRIAEGFQVPLDSIRNSTLVVFKKIFLDFEVCPNLEMREEDIGELLGRVQLFLGSSFTSTVKMKDERCVVAPRPLIEPGAAVRFSDQRGLVMVLVIPIIGAIFIIATLVATAARAFTVRMQRPQRTNKNEDIPLQSISSNDVVESSTRQLIV